MPIAQVALLAALLSTGSQASVASSNLSKIERVGKAIFEQDRAAWLATDRVFESNERLADGLRGWVTFSSDDGWRVSFVQEEGDAYCSMLSVLVGANGAGPLRQSETCEPLTTDQRAMFPARQTALSALRAPYSEAYNTVVFPPETKAGAWVAYLLAATNEAGKVIVGGHVRVLVGNDGSKTVDYQPLSKACLMFDLPPPASDSPSSLIVTHVLDNHPTETLVFLSLLHGLNLYVITDNSLWSVDKGKIRLVMDGEDFKAYMEKAKTSAREKRKSENDK